MEEAKLYYTPPSDEIFDELKAEAIEIWKGYNEPYRSEKINRIIDIRNIKDNFMYMVAMFDQQNQAKLSRALSDEAKEAVRERMISGGTPERIIVF